MRSIAQNINKKLPGTRSSMGWLWPFSRTPHLLDHCKLHIPGFIGQSIYHSGKMFTPDGPRLRAHLWSVENIFDFHQIQAEWEEKWTRDKLMRLEMTKLEGETTDQFQRHQRLLLDLFLKNNVLVPQRNFQVGSGNVLLTQVPITIAILISRLMRTICYDLATRQRSVSPLR